SLHYRYPRIRADIRHRQARSGGSTQYERHVACSLCFQRCKGDMLGGGTGGCYFEVIKPQTVGGPGLAGYLAAELVYSCAVERKSAEIIFREYVRSAVIAID